jgi:hypothetical protein
MSRRRHLKACGNSYFLEPTTGIEPVNLFLTKEVLYLLSYVGNYGRHPKTFLPITEDTASNTYLERETGFEPATFSLEG